MRFISCASYYGTGSSAITDLVSEYDEVFDFANTEFRFLQDPDGIAELEYNLIENHNRHNSGHALKRYKKLVDFYCGNMLSRKFEAYFNGKWKECSYKYIDSLTDFSYRGFWLYDLYDNGKMFHFRKRIVNKILQTTIWRSQPDRQLNTMKNVYTLCSAPTEEEFLEKTKSYIEELFGSVSGDKDIIMVDQIVPPSNVKRFQRYFKDIRVAIVDRDPRDVWTLEKYVWKDGNIPHEDVETFCKWYKYTRNHRKKEQIDGKTVIFVQFEDLIYKYDEMVAKIEEWAGLSPENHIEVRKKFNPSKSIKNTLTWKRLRGIPQDEIEYIEKELQEYLYKGYNNLDKIEELEKLID